MKVARFVLKIVAAAALVSAVVCAVIAYWDKILELFYTVADKIEEKKANCCCPSEFEDYDDAVL